MEEKDRVDVMVKLMYRRRTVTRWMVREVEKFIETVAVIFMSRLHSIEQGRTKRDEVTMLVMIATREMVGKVE